MRTSLTDLLDIRLPLIQAPMAGVSTAGLAAAVSDAGSAAFSPMWAGQGPRRVAPLAAAELIQALECELVSARPPETR